MIWKLLLIVSLILNLYSIFAINWITSLVRSNSVLIDALYDFARTFAEVHGVKISDKEIKEAMTKVQKENKR